MNITAATTTSAAVASARLPAKITHPDAALLSAHWPTLYSGSVKGQVWVFDGSRLPSSSWCLDRFSRSGFASASAIGRLCLCSWPLTGFLSCFCLILRRARRVSANHNRGRKKESKGERGEGRGGGGWWEEPQLIPIKANRNYSVSLKAHGGLALCEG